MVSVYEIKYIVSTEGFFFFSQYLDGLEEEFVSVCFATMLMDFLSEVGNY